MLLDLLQAAVAEERDRVGAAGRCLPITSLAGRPVVVVAQVLPVREQVEEERGSSCRCPGRRCPVRVFARLCRRRRSRDRSRRPPPLKSRLIHVPPADAGDATTRAGTSQSAGTLGAWTRSRPSPRRRGPGSSSAFAAPTPAQAAGWPAIATGGNVLIQAPTGSGKTLAAFLYGDRPARLDARAAACGCSTSRR